ncbi:MAG: hypothetical protein ABEI98_00090 [Halorhabdus sp.]
MSGNSFRLIQEEGYSERTLVEGDSLEEVLESAAEKSGRGDLWEALDEL